MTNNLDELLELLIYYADSIGSKRDHKAGKDMYTCPFCHSGEHGTGSTGAMHIGKGKDGTLLYYCHSCNSGGNIINMYCQHHGITQTRENFPQIIKGIKQDLGLSTEDYQGFKQSYKFRNPVQNEDLTPKTNVDKKDYTKFFNLALQNQGMAIEYLRNVRKIEYAESIAQYFQIGYMPNYAYEFENNQPSKTTSAIIIPTSQYSYAWRSTTENLKKKSGMVRPLNIEILGNNTKKFIFLVEGEFDLFSILDITNDIPNCEFSAISVNSAGNLPRFLDNQIKENIQKDTTLIIALDNDEKTNPNVENFIKQGLNIAKKSKIPCIVADVKKLYLNQKDSNEALKFNREEFKKALINEVEKAKNLDITQYMTECEEIINSQGQTEQVTHQNSVQQEKIPSIEEMFATVTFENIKSVEILEYGYKLADETQIALYYDGLTEKAKEYRLPITSFNTLLKPYKSKAFKIVKNNRKAYQNHKQDDNGIKWDIASDGRYTGTLNNIENALTTIEEYKNLKYNEFDCKLYFNGKPIDDDWVTSVRLNLVRQHNFVNVGKKEAIDVISLVGKYNSYHPIVEYFKQLPQWDSVKRVETLFIDYLGADDNEYTRKIAKITLISAVARVFSPGCWVDTITCLVGEQGIGKSKFIRKLSINDNWFTDSVTSFDGKEFYENIQGKWLIELGEGTAFKKSTKEIAKQRASATKDSYRTPYAILPTDRPRQCIFMATVNDYQFLKDETGNRRYYPIDCDKSKAKYTFKDLTPEVLSQVWAEALTYYLQGEKWYLTDDEKKIIEMAVAEQESHYEYSSLYSDIQNYLNVRICENWYTLSLQQRHDHIRAVLNGYTDATYNDGTPWRVPETHIRPFISVKEIWVELYGHNLSDVIDNRTKHEITKSLKELKYIGNKKNKHIGGYGSQYIYTKK